MSIDDLKIYTGGSRGLLGTSIYCISYPGIDLTADVVWKAFFFRDGSYLKHDYQAF